MIGLFSTLAPVSCNTPPSVSNSLLNTSNGSEQVGTSSKLHQRFFSEQRKIIGIVKA
jgi:hypothetical protein